MRTIMAVLMLMLMLTAGCTATQTAPVERFTIAAGPEGGVYYDLGRALADEARRRWSVPAEVLPTQESVENVRRLDAGEAIAGFTTLDVGMMAFRGNPPFNAAVRVRALAGIYVDYLYVVVRADSGITDLRGLADRRVAMGPRESGLQIVASRVMNGIPIPEHLKSPLPPAEAAKALRSGDIDAFFVLGGLPTPVVTELDNQMDIRVLPVDSQYARLRSQFGETYVRRSIPDNAYRMPGPVITLGVPNALVVRADLPDETAYRLTQLLFAAKPRLAAEYSGARHLDHRSALATIPLPLHPGAERYYRDAKPMVLGPMISSP